MYTKFNVTNNQIKLKYTEQINWKKVTRFFVTVFVLICIIFTSSIYFQENYLYKQELKTEVGKVYLTSKDMIDLEDKISEILGSYNLNIISKIDSNKCIYNNLFEMNDNSIVVCYKDKQIEIAYEGFSKERILAYNWWIIIFYSIITTALITMFFIISNTYLLKKIDSNVNSENIHLFIESKFDNINSSMLNYKLGNIENDIKELYILCTAFISLDIQNFYIIESKIMKQINVAKTLYLDSQAKSLFILFKEIEIFYLEKAKKYGQIVSRYFLMLTSKHFTSTGQLSLFILFFTFVTTFHLRLFYEIPRNTNESFIFYLTQVVNVFSNLGGEIDFTTTVELIFAIYLQLVGIVVLGILIGIINREIK